MDTDGMGSDLLVRFDLRSALGALSAPCGERRACVICATWAALAIPADDRRGV
jgi:hypothetical protein